MFITNGGRYVARNGNVVTISNRKYRTAYAPYGVTRNYPFVGDFKSTSGPRTGKLATFTIRGAFQKSGTPSQFDLIAPFRVAAGKTYLTRNGKMVTLRARSGGKNYPFEADTLSPRGNGKPVSYTADGLFQRGAASPMDLVKEVAPPVGFNTAAVTPPPAYRNPWAANPAAAPAPSSAPVVIVKEANGSATLRKNGGPAITLTAAEFAALKLAI